MCRDLSPPKPLGQSKNVTLKGVITNSIDFRFKLCIRLRFFNENYFNEEQKIIFKKCMYVFVVKKNPKNIALIYCWDFSQSNSNEKKKSTRKILGWHAM